MNTSLIKSMNIFEKSGIWQYVVMAVILFILLIIIIIILCCKYFKKNDMTQMDIGNENNPNVGNINNKNEENVKKDSSYEKIATEVESRELKNNKDNQNEIVIESV